MGNISEHFNREEFECKCGCGLSPVDKELIDVLEDIRSFFGEPIIVTSGNRCDDYNRSIGGAYESKHKVGIACDFKVKNELHELVYEYLEHKYRDKYGLGLYDTWVHIDMRSVKARWNKQTK